MLTGRQLLDPWIPPLQLLQLTLTLSNRWNWFVLTLRPGQRMGREPGWAEAPSVRTCSAVVRKIRVPNGREREWSPNRGEAEETAIRPANREQGVCRQFYRHR